MGLFGKKKTELPTKKPKAEKNRINDTALREELANAAIATLTAGEDYTSPEGIQCEFGYIIDIEEHGLEALFKVTTDKGVFYFADQRGKILRLAFDEKLFRVTTDSFLAIHCNAQ